MKKFLFLSLMSVCAFNSYAVDKIIGGDVVDASMTETRYIVSLSSSCAGSIIAPKWILTAAHCRSVFTRPVTGGSVDLNSTKRIKLEVKQSYIHPKNNSSTFSYDFALLELKEPIDFAATGLTSIDLVTPELAEKGAIDEGVIATVLGWGSTREGGSVTPLLRKVEVPIVGNKRANASYNGKVDSTMLAAGLDEGAKDSCQGDSGGPLTVVGSDGRPVLAGVVSWGQGCARAKYYGLYGNVSVGYPWIKETISK
jgi:trypsin